MGSATSSGDMLTRNAVEDGERGAVAALLQDHDAFLFDCDGTLYHAGRILPNVADALNHLRSRGKKLFFVTNTSSRSREQLQEKLLRLGVPCEAEECIPSGVFAASYVRRAHPEARHVYVIGGQGVVDELRKVGIESSGGPLDDHRVFEDSDFESMAESVGKQRYDGVVVGWDTSLTYYKIAKSSLVFQKHPGCFFYATNDDAADRVGECLLPGNGCLLKAIEAACEACAPQRRGQEAPYGSKAVSLGKPNADFASLIAKWNNIDLTRAVIVGDRLETDIMMGIRAGMSSCLVLTGVDGLEQVAETGIRPKFVLPSVGSLWTERAGGSARL